MHLRRISTCEDMAHDDNGCSQGVQSSKGQADPFSFCEPTGSTMQSPWIMDVHKVFSPQKARTTLSVSVKRLAARTCAAPGMTQSTLRKTLYKC